MNYKRKTKKVKMSITYTRVHSNFLSSASQYLFVSNILLMRALISCNAM